MNNVTAKNEVEKVANELYDILNNDSLKFTEPDREQLKAAYNSLLKIFTSTTLDRIEIETFKSNLKKAREDIKKAKQQIVDERLDEIEKRIKRLENAADDFFKMMEILKRQPGIREFVKNNKKNGEALREILRANGIKNVEIIKNVKEIIMENSNWKKMYEGEYGEGSLEADIKHIFYDDYAYPYKIDRHKTIWNLMLRVLEKCLEEKGQIKFIYLKDNQDDFFEQACNYYLLVTFKKHIMEGTKYCNNFKRKFGK